MKKILLLFIAAIALSFSSRSQVMNCGNFCVLSLGNLDTLNNTLEVTIYNGDVNSVNYPTIVVVDGIGDTIANKTNYFYLFLHPAGDTLTQTIPCDADSIPAGFTGTVYLTDQVWDTTCAFAYPMACTVGIPEYTKEHSLLIYPNPASATINISLGELKDPAHIILSDMTGRTVKELTAADSQISIDRGDLRSGMYFMSVEIGDKRITKKIVLK